VPIGVMLMFRKVCSTCKRPSYSACKEVGGWICPYCGTDMTGIPVEISEEMMCEHHSSSHSSKTAKEG